MSFQDTCKCLEKAGVKATPVPGTSKYYISFPDGESMYVREKSLVGLAKLAIKEPVAIIQKLKELQMSCQEDKSA